MSPLLVWLVFAGLAGLVCLITPAFRRVCVGIFSCTMAIGVNLSIAIVAPHLFVELVDGAHPGISRPLGKDELPNVIFAAGLAHLLIARYRAEHWRHDGILDVTRAFVASRHWRL